MSSHKRHGRMSDPYPSGSYSNNFSFPLLAGHTEPRWMFWIPLYQTTLSSLPTTHMSSILNLESLRLCWTVHQSFPPKVPKPPVMEGPGSCTSPVLFTQRKQPFNWFIWRRQSEGDVQWKLDGWVDFAFVGFWNTLHHSAGPPSRELTANNLDYAYVVAHTKGCPSIAVKRSVSKGGFPMWASMAIKQTMQKLRG